MTSPGTLPYIGSKISLISNAGIRYEGILYNINTRDSTVGLSNVRTYGTEGRKPGRELLPSDDVYDFIVFKGKDIMDLTVSDPSPPDDPAIVAINPMPSPTGQPDHVGSGLSHAAMRHHHQMAVGGGPNDYLMGRDSGGGAAAHLMHGVGGLSQSQVQHHQQQQMPVDSYGMGMGMRHSTGQMSGMQGRVGNAYSSGPGADVMGLRIDDGRRVMAGNAAGYQSYQSYAPRRGGGGYGYRGRGRSGGGYQNLTSGGSRRIIGELPAQPNQTLKSQLETAFDFDEANRKFDKNLESPTGTAAAGATATSTGTAGQPAAAGAEVKELSIPDVYDKKTSFFDRLSCEALDRQSGQGNKMDRTKQRQLDVETFGQQAAYGTAQRGGYRIYNRRGMMQGSVMSGVPGGVGVPGCGMGSGMRQYHAGYQQQWVPYGNRF